MPRTVQPRLALVATLAVSLVAAPASAGQVGGAGVGAGDSTAAAAGSQGVSAEGWSGVERRLRAAIRINPEAAVYHAGLADALHRQGRIEEAIESYRTAVQLAPAEPSHRAQLGATLLETGAWDRAEAQYRQAIHLDSTRSEYHAGLGEALRAQGLLLPAAAALRRAVELEPANPDLRRLLEGVEARLPGGGPGERGGGPLSWVAPILTFAFALILVAAGIGLVLPLFASFILVAGHAPVALLRRLRR